MPSARRWSALDSVGRELVCRAVGAEGQEIATAVAPEAPPLGDNGELVHGAVALLAADPLLDQLVPMHPEAPSYRSVVARWERTQSARAANACKNACSTCALSPFRQRKSAFSSAFRNSPGWTRTNNPPVNRPPDRDAVTSVWLY